MSYYAVTEVSDMRIYCMQWVAPLAAAKNKYQHSLFGKDQFTMDVGCYIGLSVIGREKVLWSGWKCIVPCIFHPLILSIPSYYPSSPCIP